MVRPVVRSPGVRRSYSPRAHIRPAEGPPTSPLSISTPNGKFEMSDTPTRGSSLPPQGSPEVHEVLLPAGPDVECEGRSGARGLDEPTGLGGATDGLAVDGPDQVTGVQLPVGRAAGHDGLDQCAGAVIPGVAGQVREHDGGRVELALVHLRDGSLMLLGPGLARREQ